VKVDPRTPCVIGVAQRTWHLAGDEWAPEPLAMQAEVVGAAATDAEASGDVLAAVDGLDVVHCMSWPYDDPTGRLCEATGMSPARSAYSGIGGTVPQQLLNAAAHRIRAGEADVEVVVGAEALDTKRRMKKAGERPAWSHRHPEPPAFPFEAPFHPAEVAHEVFQAWLTFAVRDVARRAATGVGPEEHRARLGRLLAPMTDVAAANPHAWFPEARTAEELTTPGPGNRMVGYPYTKSMVAVMDVDMAASVVIASWGAADRLGVPVERRVPLRGWCFATDATYLAEHPDLARSPAMATASSAALQAAGAGIDDIAHLELYSCFASSLDFARDALGLDDGDTRPLTVTGGLPYAGGPASNYLSHALASMVRVLREEPGSLGLLSGVGMHMTKHGFAVYGGDPATVAPVEVDGPAVQAALCEAHPPRAISESATGPATVAAYSVVHGRDGDPAWGLAVVDLPDGSRAYARTEDRSMLGAWEAEEFIGRKVTLRTDGTVNTLTVG
jgi:acetyl-CoA C-acetyltransferase